MLLADRGIKVSQEEIAAQLPMPTAHTDLARRLRQVSHLHWRGGGLGADAAITFDLVDQICQTYGSWAALLEPQGAGQVGHWVVVDGVTDDGVVLVRDPVGEAYGIPLADFEALWSYTILVIEEVSP